jgi:iron complex outermembrane recepter protein
MLGVPAVNVNLGIEWDVARVPGLTLATRVLRTGDAFVDAANTQRLPAWTRIDASARFRTSIAGRDVTLRAAVDNVLDAAYYNVGARNLFAVAPPRTWNVGASVDW